MRPANGTDCNPITARFCRSNDAEVGMILLLALALLAGLSLLALLAASSMLQQENMAANHADKELARLAAMTAISSGEQFLLALPTMARSENCSLNCFDASAESAVHDSETLPLNPEFLPDEWWTEWGLIAKAKAANGFDEAAADSAWSLPGRYPPQFLLEELTFLKNDEPSQEQAAPLVSGVGYYRVLGRGSGIAESSTHVVESIFARPWPVLSPENQSDGINCKAYRPWYDCGRMAWRERR